MSFVSPPILVVDDDADNRNLLRAYLEAEGHDVAEVDSGEKALDFIRTRPVALVLLDVMLPGLSGFDVCRRIKRDAQTAATPVLMVTALGDTDSRAKAFDSDADEFIAKPVFRRELIARIRGMLRLKRMQALRDAGRDAVPQCVSGAVMVTGIRGVTAMADAPPPHEVVTVLNEHFTSLTRVAHRHKGTIFSMNGDGLLIGFGVPVPEAEPCRSAIAAALEMQREFRALSESIERRYGIGFGLGIGISYGPVILGSVGSDPFVAFTIIGDTVNVAARLQDAGDPGSIIATQAVRDAVPDLASQLVAG